MTGSLPALRQIVLLADDLDRSVADVRDFLGLSAGIQAAAEMAALGFEHEVLAIDQTFVEVVSPLSSDTSPGRLLARHGDTGYMVVVQVADLAAVVAGGDRLGLTPSMREVLHGNAISQWHPRDLGTLTEIDEMTDGATWHFCPELSDTGLTDTVSDLISVDIAAAEPASTAGRWAALLGLPAPSGTQVSLARGTVRFVPADGRRGLVAATFAPGSSPSGAPGRRGATICGVQFTIDTPDMPTTERKS